MSQLHWSLWFQAEPTQQGRTYFDRRLGSEFPCFIWMCDKSPGFELLFDYIMDQCWILLKMCFFISTVTAWDWFPISPSFLGFKPRFSQVYQHREGGTHGWNSSTWGREMISVTCSNRPWWVWLQHFFERGIFGILQMTKAILSAWSLVIFLNMFSDSHSSWWLETP